MNGDLKIKTTYIIIIAVIIIIGAGLYNYDSRNADTRKGIHNQAMSVMESIVSYEKMLERTIELQSQVDQLLLEMSHTQNISEKGRQIHNRAIQHKNEISDKQVKIKVILKQQTDEYHNLVEEYNRISRNILFGAGTLPREMSKYKGLGQAL